MMRYQRVSTDYLPPLTNGVVKKPYLMAARGFNGESSTTTSSSTLTDGIPKSFRFKSQSNTPQDPSPSGGGDVLLQWGQRKRSRISRAEIRSTNADDSSSSSGQGKMQSNKLQRRSANPFKPPPSPLLCNGNTTPRNGFVIGKGSLSSSSSGFLPITRNLEDRSRNGSPARNIVGGGGSARMVSRSANLVSGLNRSSPSPDQKTEKRSNIKDLPHHQQRQNGFDHQRVKRSDSTTAQTHQELEINNNINGEQEKEKEKATEWPRFYIALSRKEKEEDFLIMKGTKLPHRPRKRAKNIDKALQYCYPGMLLSILTKNRYEVKEKKNVKKQQKRRGLKGMENLDTDSD